MRRKPPRRDAAGRKVRSRSSREPAPLKHPATGELATAFARVVELAKALPGCEESRSYGTPSLKVKGRFMARLRTEAEGGLAIRCDLVAPSRLVAEFDARQA